MDFNSKAFKLIPILLIFGCLCGCSLSNQPPMEDTETAPSISVPETLPFEFPVPEGYTLTPTSLHSVSVLQDGQAVGGIRNAVNLHDVCMTDSTCSHLWRYMRQNYSPDSMDVNLYITRHDNYVTVSAGFGNLDPDTAREQSHYFFEKDGAYYDFWVDDNLVSEEDRDTIFKSITGEMD